MLCDLMKFENTIWAFNVSETDETLYIGALLALPGAPKQCILVDVLNAENGLEIDLPDEVASGGVEWTAFAIEIYKPTASE